MAKDSELPKPSFYDQACTLIDQRFKDSEKIENPKFGPGLSPFDHKLWVSIMELHVDHVESVLIEGFASKVAEHYDPIMAAIDRLEKSQIAGQAKIDKSIKRITTKVNKLETRIERLESNFNIIFEEHLKNHKPKSSIRI